MSISVVCQCGKKFQAKDEHAGARTKCPVCAQPLTIPNRSQAQPAPAAAPKPEPPAPRAASSPPTYEGKRVTDWLELLQVDDAAARKHAVEVLSTVGPEAVAELSVFVDRLEADHVLLRNWAVTCLGQIGPPARSALEALLNRLDDEQPLIREKTAAALERIEPASAAFVARLRRGLNDKSTSTRISAVTAFRRDIKTLGITRCRFWACSCGSVYEKDDLEDRLKLLADGGEMKWQGARGCKKCGKSYALRDLYAGKHDVPPKFWPQLVKRFGDRVQVPDDFLTDPSQESQGYQISDSQMFDALTLGLPTGSLMPVVPVPDDATDSNGYALAAEVQVRHGPVEHDESAAENELVPGAVVPQTGKYKCTACHKVRISESKSSLKLGTAAKTTVVKHFKAGKPFSECPHCGDITEWQLISEP